MVRVSSLTEGVLLIKDYRSSRKAWLFITIFAIHSPFLPLFLGGKRKGKENNHSRGKTKKSCLSAWSRLQLRFPFCIECKKSAIGNIHFLAQQILIWIHLIFKLDLNNSSDNRILEFGNHIAETVQTTRKPIKFNFDYS